MLKSSIVFLFTATLLSAAQSSQPAQTPKPAPVPAPAQQPSKQPYSTVVPNSGLPPDSEKIASPQDPPFRKLKVAVPPKSKPERFPTGILDKETPA
jgi:hypothetical protein